jgi:hypothetical protein
LGRAGRNRAECDLCADRRSFTARNHSHSDTHRSAANRNAIDRAAVNCLTSSDSDRDTTTNCIPEPFTNIDSNCNGDRIRNSAAKPDPDANSNCNSASESDSNADSATKSDANGNIGTANHAKRDAVAIFNSNTIAID